MNNDTSIHEPEAIDYLDCAKSWAHNDGSENADSWVAAFALIDIAQSLRRIADVLERNHNDEQAEIEQREYIADRKART